MHPLTGDLAYFIKVLQGKLTGMVGTDVDDIIAAGNDDYQKESQITGRVFKAKDKVLDSFTFAGINIKKEGKTYL